MRLTKEMKFETALRLVADVKRDCWDYRDEDEREMAEQIAGEAHGQHEDGYSLARRLDDHCGWTIDTELVDVLDNWSSHARCVLEEAQKTWREQHKPVAAFDVGARVRLKDGSVGVVTDTDYQYGVAQYLVRIDGDPLADSAEARRIVNWEDANPEAADPDEVGEQGLA